MMNGNPHYEIIADQAMLPEHGIVHAILALAFEVRTQTLVSYMTTNDAALTEGIDVEIRERLGRDV